MRRIKEKINYYCIMFEGIFQLMGTELLGLTSIVPLFLLEYGATTGIIGMMMTLQAVTGAIVPLVLGNIVARAPSKRKLSLITNTLTRGSLVVLPILLISGFSNKVIVIIFMMVMFVHFVGKPFHGLAWFYLLANTITMKVRPKLLGVLFAISGVVSFGASYYIKLIRDSQVLLPHMKYFYIFGASSIAMILSVLAFIPLKETVMVQEKKKVFRVKEYIGSLLACYKIKDFRHLVRARVFSQTSMLMNAFLFIYASTGLKLESTAISNLIILQTLGIIIGGVVTGQVSSRFGVKRMLILNESAGLLIPILALICLKASNPLILFSVCILLVGFNRSGIMGYSNYMIEVIEQEKVIFGAIASSVALLPISFLSSIAGLYIQTHSMRLIFIGQIIASSIAIVMCVRLRLVRRESLL